MKLSNPNDKRSMRDYKKSCSRFTTMHAPSLDLRHRPAKGSANIKLAAKPARSKVVRQTVNPFKTEVGSSHGFKRKLEAAAVCCTHGVMRMVPLQMIPKYQDVPTKHLLCKLCLSRGIKQHTSWACISCGAELCNVPRTMGKNRYPNIISCGDAAHQQHKINIADLTLKK